MFAGELKVPSIDEQADMYETAIEKLSAEGFYRYEISNFAKNPDSESVHNKNVWQGMQYIGVGPGAHSRVVNKDSWIKESRINVPDPHNWFNQVDKIGHGNRKVSKLSLLDAQLEYISTSLRTRVGATEDQWEIYSSNKTLKETFEGVIDQGPFGSCLTYENGSLKMTPKGLNVLDLILPDLINIVKYGY